MSLLVVVTACGAGPRAEPTPTTTTVTPSTTTDPTTITNPPSAASTTGDLDVIVPPNDNGEYPEGLMVTCGSGAFPVGALEGITPLSEADPGGVAAAIGPFLSSEEGLFWPQEGWHVLHETDSQILLVARDGENLSFMTVTRDGSSWTWSGASSSGDRCDLEFVVPEDLNGVDWRLDPSGPQLSAETTTVPVIVNERECTGGQEIGDRLLGPQVVMTETRVLVAFAAERPEGDAFTCPSNPDMSYVVELPEPLGDRELVEGLKIGLVLEDYVP